VRTNLKVDGTQAAWRDFAIGLVLFLGALTVVQSTPRLLDALGVFRWMPQLLPVAMMGVQALLVAVTVFGHAALYRRGRFREVTGTVTSFGRLGALRSGVVGVAALVLMFGVWRIAERIGGPILRPLVWATGILDRGAVSFGFFLAMSFYVVVTTPILEELCFRGWMQRGLGRRFSPGVTIVTPAVLFTALHAASYSDPGYLLIPLALGLILGLVAERSRSVWPSVVLHSAWNSTMLVLAARNAARSLSGPPPNALPLMAAFAAIGLSSFVLLRALSRTDLGADRAGSHTALDTQAAA
jgi:membrane protease YdiL (CAAX protease family)